MQTVLLGTCRSVPVGEQFDAFLMDNVYLVVGLLARREGACLSSVCVLPESFPESLCQLALPPGEHASSGCITPGIIFLILLNHSSTPWFRTVLFTGIDFPDG